MVPECKATSCFLGWSRRWRGARRAGACHGAGGFNAWCARRDARLLAASDARPCSRCRAARRIIQVNQHPRLRRLPAVFFLPLCFFQRKIFQTRGVFFQLMTGLLAIVIAYLIGGIPFGYLLVRLTTGK